MKICPKHDVLTGDNEQCWCCEEVQLHASGKKEASYKDPAFLVRRGGGSFQSASAHAAMNMLSQLTPEQLANLVMLAQATAAGTVHPALAVHPDQMEALKSLGTKRSIA